jgi:hypothetical protein
MDRPADQPQDADPGQPHANNPLARISAITGNNRPVAPASNNGTTPTAPTPTAPMPTAPMPTAPMPTAPMPTDPAPSLGPAAEPPAGPRLGRLQRVDAAKLWPTDVEFSRWLADNLDAVGETVSLRLAKAELLDGELPVVLAAADDGASAVVLAQRGPSTDDAFGSLVRHFAASAAQHAVWICGEPSSEHVAAVSWLNRAVDGRFVMLRVGAVKIGESAAAPMFELAVRSPRADDPHMESDVPEAHRADDGERRADDWLGSLRAEAVAAEPESD